MEVANASLYDGASALAEALFMAIRITKKTKVAVSSLIHPHYRQVIKAYFKPTAYEIIEVPYLDNGRTDSAKTSEIDDIAAFAVQSPNFFGSIEDLKTLCNQSKKIDALFITCFTEPLAYGLLKNPGSLGADIVCGEGQSLGIAQSFGGPALGMFASKNEYVRKMPGRLVGKTSDVDGKRGFVLTLAAREQHIRREKATSNICTNSNLNALSAAIYMASLGGTGMRELALLNHDKAEYLKAALKKAGVIIRFKAPTFNEFVIKAPAGFGEVYERLLGKNMAAGLPLAKFYPELDNEYLLCVTETKTKKDMDDLVKEIKS
jgi:glycine dehydrogenase subunit 1